MFTQLRILPVVRILTLLLCLLHAPKLWYLRLPIRVLCICGFALPRFRCAWQCWFLLASFIGATTVMNWHWLDNHKYLLAYWLLSMTIVHLCPRDQRDNVLAENARLLIGLCMLLAAIWKISEPQYRSGAFFEYTLLTDKRFAGAAELLDAGTRPKLKENRRLVFDVKRDYLTGSDLTSGTLNAGPRLPLMATLATWWTFGIEIVLGLVFLWPTGRRIAYWRTTLLLLFCITTYAVASVKAFGWLLLIMGIAQSPPKADRLRAGMFATMLLLELYSLPTGRILEALLAYMGS